MAVPVFPTGTAEFFCAKNLDKYSGLWYNVYIAGVSEWQTRQTQNLLSARACGFESHHRHAGSPRWQFARGHSF